MSQRLFVGNLPPGVTENDLRNEFNSYGKVQNIEIKSKVNIVDPENPNIFAFVTLDINKQMISRCIDEFRQTQYCGRYLNISIAKESFLDRLKREREEANTSKKSTELSKNEKNDQKKLPQILVQQTIKSTDLSSASDSDPDSTSSGAKQTDGLKNQKLPNKAVESSHSKEVDTVFMSKKRAASSLQNGKIKIDCVKNEPIHVINKNVKELKKFDAKAKISDEKRKESLSKMKNQYDQQKLAIQKALSSVDTNKSKKIVFDESDDNDDVKDSKKVNLFSADEDDGTNGIENYEKDFEIKAQYEGESGEKLMKLQSKFKSDPRFQMDARFMDNDNETGTKLVNNDNDDEKNWQLKMIENATGNKLQILPDQSRKKSAFQKNMLRYDPTVEQEQEKFLKNTEKVVENFNEKESVSKSIAKKNKNLPNLKLESKTSKEQFYTVSEDLKNSLKRRGDGFSLLSLFGRDESLKNENDAITDATFDDTKKNDNNLEEIPSLISKLEKYTDNDLFKYDSSSADDSEVENSLPLVSASEHAGCVVNNISGKSLSGSGSKTKSGVWNESFFIFENDQRLKDGFLFFKQCEKKATDEQEEAEDYNDVRENLRILIKKKIVKSRKNKKLNKSQKKRKLRR